MRVLVAEAFDHRASEVLEMWASRSARAYLHLLA